MQFDMTARARELGSVAGGNRRSMAPLWQCALADPVGRTPDVRRHVLWRHDVGRMVDWTTRSRRTFVRCRGSREIPSIEVTRLAEARDFWPAHAMDSASLHNATVTTALLARPVY